MNKITTNFKESMLLVVLLSILLSFTFCVNSASALTGSIGNARVVLYPSVGFFGTTIERTILVKNVNDYEINVTVVPEGNFSEIAKIIDTNFILQPQEEKEARLTLTIKKPGDYSGKINVLFAPENGYGAGVALQSTIIIHATKSGGNPDTDTNDSTNSTETYLGSGLVNDIKNSNPVLIALSISTLVLIIIFIVLIVLISNKNRKNKKDNENRGQIKTIKRSVRSV